jgi:Ca2+-binding EF-hand superfamily protein
MQHQPPAFAEVDADGDGFVSEEEFNAFHAERHAAKAEAGKPMKGMASAPAFADIDSDGDDKLTEAELTAAHQAHMQAMQEAHKDMCGGKGEGKCMHHGMKEGMKMPAFGDLDLDGDGCISAEEFAKHQAEMHG